MLNGKTVVLALEVEGFRRRKENFIVKEFEICNEDYLDCVSFLPTTHHSEFLSFSWLNRNLHGIDCDMGNYPYIYLTQTTQSFRLQKPGAIF